MRRLGGKMPATHYETLGVSRDASAEEIGAAFRKRAKELHPDMQGGDAEKFKRANEAYSVLKDTYKRSIYDLQTQLQAQSTTLRKTASKSEVRINILASAALLAIGVLFWVQGDKPDASYNGYLVALGWGFILYGIGLFVDRKSKFSNPLIIAKRVAIYVLLSIIGFVIRLSAITALLLALVGLAAISSWILSRVF